MDLHDVFDNYEFENFEQALFNTSRVLKNLSINIGI